MIRLRMGKFMAAGRVPGTNSERMPPFSSMAWENFVIFPWVADVYPAAQDCVGGLSTLDGASVGIAVHAGAMPLMMLTPALASSPA